MMATVLFQCLLQHVLHSVDVSWVPEVSLLSAHGFQEHCELLLRAALGGRRFSQADGLRGSGGP